MNKIEWTSRARKQLKRVPQMYQLLIVDAVDSLTQPAEHWNNVVSLKQHRYDYRMRVGRYRVLFDFDGEPKIVGIQEVKKRDERTY
ncbi:MAG: type II toxin-antitoxin system RelE/ParE family toxin [Deltaproteobacteria bacterium]|jgi:mRNA-degrading endonuclease RelE of RelBE toxin-antitoxin system|nr:type II toxin-antitoxin system RelE/ParE family toxin [Deltaproteobacteria bacterium]